MHDLMYAKQIINKLEENIKNGKKDTNIIVNICLSSFSHVTPDDLKETFSMLAEDEGYVNTVLNVNLTEFCIRCKKCGETWKSAKATFKCPKCDKEDFEIEKWEEFYVDSIEIEK